MAVAVIEPLLLLAPAAFLLKLLDPPGAAVLRQPLEGRHRVQRLRSEHARAAPRPAGQQLERDDRVDRGLPDHALVAVLAHRPLVVDDVVEVRRPRPPVRARAGDPETRAGLARHAGTDR